MYSKECQYCGQKIETDNKYQLGAHVANCVQNPNYNKLKPHVKLVYNLTCQKCDKSYTVNISEINFNKGKYTKFCCRGCANSRIITQEHKDKNKLALSKGITIHSLECVICNDVFNSENKNMQTCSKECLTKLLQKHGSINGLKSAQVQADSRRSKNEIAFSELCIEKFNDVECNKAIFNGWDADIIIHDLKIAILWNGKWHYEKITQKHSVAQVQNRDKIKIKEIIKYGYSPYIIKDLGQYDIDKVNNEWHIFLNTLNN